MTSRIGTSTCASPSQWEHYSPTSVPRDLSKVTCAHDFVAKSQIFLLRIGMFPPTPPHYTLYRFISSGEVSLITAIISMDYYPRVPSRVVGLNDAVSGNRHDGENVQQLKMLPPPALIHTVPSYVSNRSISNRSVSNHSVSRRSVGTSATKGRRPQNAATREAELIAVANTQARAAAQSILLAGGSQAAALSTAKAAAKSVLQPAKEDGDGKPPLGSTRNNHFRNRRKNRQQAEIIASMALVSANEALEYGYMGQDAMTMTPGGLRSAYQDERDSEFPDDYTNFRSLAPSVYGRSHSVRSQHEMQLLRFPEYYEQARLDKQSIQPLKALEQEIKIVGPSTGTVQEQSYADQSTLNSRGQDTKTSLLLTKVPSMKALFQGIQGPSNIEKVTPSEAAEKGPRIKIPTDLPRSNSIKAFAPLKLNGSGKPPAKNDRTSTPRSRQQFSESQISCYSDRSSVSHTNSYSYAGSTYDEHTADYTRGTFESAVDSTTRKKSYMNRRGGTSFFSTMDPFVRTFSEVFSCAPPVPLKRTPDDSQSVTNSRFQMHESRDMATTSEYDSKTYKDERRDQPPPVGPVINTAVAAPRRSSSVAIAAPRRSTSVDDSILSTNDIHSLIPVDQTVGTTHKDFSKNKIKVKSPTMEQLVLRALSAISPKGAASKRPRLNVKPPKPNAGPDTMTKYRSFEGDTGKIPAKGSAKNVRVGKETGMLKVLTRSSMKPRKDESVSHNSDAIASLGKNSSSNQESQQHQPSSGSSEYYISASTDDSANVMAATETTTALAQGPTTMSQKSNTLQKNMNVESKMKRFPSMPFHRSRRSTRTTAGE